MVGKIYKEDIHSNTHNRKALGFVVLEKKIFYTVPIRSLCKLMTPRAGSFLTPGAWLPGLIKRATIH